MNFIDNKLLPDNIVATSFLHKRMSTNNTHSLQEVALLLASDAAKFAEEQNRYCISNIHDFLVDPSKSVLSREALLNNLKNCNNNSGKYFQTIYNLLLAYADESVLQNCVKFQRVSVPDILDKKLLIVGTDTRSPYNWLHENLIDIAPLKLQDFIKRHYIVSHGACSRDKKTVPYAALEFSFDLGKNRTMILAFVALSRNSNCIMPENYITTDWIHSEVKKLLNH